MKLKRLLASENGQILRQIIKIGLIVVIIVLVIVEVGPIIWCRISIMNDAEDVANAVALDYRLMGKDSDSLNLAGEKLRMMDYSDEEIAECRVELLPVESNTKQKVRVTLVKFANTLVTRNIGPLKKFSKITRSHEANITTATRQQ